MGDNYKKGPKLPISGINLNSSDKFDEKIYNDIMNALNNNKDNTSNEGEPIKNSVSAKDIPIVKLLNENKEVIDYLLLMHELLNALYTKKIYLLDAHKYESFNSYVSRFNDQVKSQTEYLVGKIRAQERIITAIEILVKNDASKENILISINCLRNYYNEEDKKHNNETNIY